MSKKLMAFLERTGDRRGFLAKAAAACAAFAAGLLGFARPAKALRYVYCCVLCTSDCSSWSCACWWSWLCCHGGKYFSCMECYWSSYGCNGGCTNIRCSRALYEGFNC